MAGPGDRGRPGHLPPGARRRTASSPHPRRTYGAARSGETLASMALSRRSLIRPPWPWAATRDENRACPAKLGSRCGRARCYPGDFRFRMRFRVDLGKYQAVCHCGRRSSPEDGATRLDRRAEMRSAWDQSKHGSRGSGSDRGRSSSRGHYGPGSATCVAGGHRGGKCPARPKAFAFLSAMRRPGSGLPARGGPRR
jgi:hypothetical protein